MLPENLVMNHFWACSCKHESKQNKQTTKSELVSEENDKNTARLKRKKEKKGSNPSPIRK
jgi:hypothetical protein